MRQKCGTRETTPEQIVKDFRRATRKHHSAEEKIRVVLDGLRDEYNIAELCRREGIAESLYYCWSKEFFEAGKRRVAGGNRTGGDNRRGEGPAARGPGHEAAGCRPHPGKSPAQKRAPSGVGETMNEISRIRKRRLFHGTFLLPQSGS